jgi:hypothetical protein
MRRTENLQTRGWAGNTQLWGSSAVVDLSWRRKSGVAEEARTRGFATPAFAGCAFVVDEDCAAYLTY